MHRILVEAAPGVHPARGAARIAANIVKLPELLHVTQAKF
jgi:hypothetical protein